MLLAKIDQRLAKIESYVLTFLLLGMIVLSAYQVVTRNWMVLYSLPLFFWQKLGGSAEPLSFLKSISGFLSQSLPPLVWGDAVVRNLVLWVGFVGASIAAQEGGHLAIDFVTHFTPKNFKKYSSIFTSLVSAVVCALLSRAAYHFFQDEKMAGSYLIQDVLPYAYAIAIIPLGFLMMSLRFFMKTLEAFLKLFQREAS